MKKIVYKDDLKGKSYILYLILKLLSLITFKKIRSIEDYKAKLEQEINNARALYLGGKNF